MTLITLVGLPGSGKSTVGRQLARRLSRTFVDSDQSIEREIGCSIREFFERQGEERFRQVEHQVLAGLCGSHEGVLATGGGIVLRAENRLLLKSAGPVVYLQATATDLSRRLRHDRQRPLLQGGDAAAKLLEMEADRDPLYREVADLVVETAHRSVYALVQAIETQLET